MYSIHKCADIHNAMTNVTNAKHQTSDQHVELGRARIKRDNIDLEKVCIWFANFNPFFPTDPNLRSLHSGMTSIQGQDNVIAMKQKVLESKCIRHKITRIFIKLP